MSAKPRGFRIIPTNNPSVVAFLGIEYDAFIIISGGCSCDLYFEHSEEDNKDNESKLRNRYKRKKWSNNKIDRAIHNSIDSHKLGKTGLIQQVIDYISDVVKKTKEIKIFVHWYNGGVEIEKLQILHGPRLELEEFIARRKEILVDHCSTIKL